MSRALANEIVQFVEVYVYARIPPADGTFSWHLRNENGRFNSENYSNIEL